MHRILGTVRVTRQPGEIRDTGLRFDTTDGNSISSAFAAVRCSAVHCFAVRISATLCTFRVVTKLPHFSNCGDSHAAVTGVSHTAVTVVEVTLK